MKLYGGSCGNRTQAIAAAPSKKNPWKPLAVVLACLVLVEVLYFTAIYSQNSFIRYWRSAYIETAMDTLNHKWLATAIIPPDVIQEVMDRRTAASEQVQNVVSTWETDTEETPIQIDVNIQPEETQEERQKRLKAEFYALFHELDPATFEAYLADHPQVLESGWDNLYINEAGLDDDGTSIQTIYGEQVLAIDVPNQILIVRVSGSGYQGVLAIAKDPAQLSLQPSSQLGVVGEPAGVIAEAHNGILAMTASGFDDPNGNGDGGLVGGYAMCDGKVCGSAHAPESYKRLELHEDNLLYITGAQNAVGEGTTDAMEFVPAMIVNGEILIDANSGYTGLHPRACIGQCDKYEILMLVIEGRMLRSVGTDLIECSEILARHGAVQAMNVDGGSSAMMWYDGEYLNICANQNLAEGRPLPTAFVYARRE